MRSLSVVALLLAMSLPALGQTETAAEKPKQESKKKKSDWIQLFNGKDMEGWVPKIRYHELGENYADTFRVEDGVLKVRYDKYDGPFKERFGHLFYKQKFSHYILRVEYRFLGKQHAGGPGWAIRNSGLMLHGEDPRGMTKDQDFPASIEVQLLGGVKKAARRATLNLCTPMTNVEYKGKLHLPHIVKSKAKTYHGDDWVTVEVEVRGSEYVRHKIDGKVVLEYQKPQLDERNEHAKKLIKNQGGRKLLEGGTISIQSESHPCEFRKIELKPLKKAA